MTPKQWKFLLTSWSAQLRITKLKQHLDAADQELAYLGFSPASESAVASLETRLGVKLPPSYRAFLEASDGFRVISPFIYRLRSTADVDWFRVENQGWIETWNEPSFYSDPAISEPSDDEYFDYAKANEHSMRTRDMIALLQVSDVGDGVMLLNPLAVTPDGEWEAWFLANWIPGAYRYPSFAHMMVGAYRTLRELENLPDNPPLPELAIPGADIPRHRVVETPATPKPSKRKRKPRRTQIELVAEMMTAQNEFAPAPPELIQLLHDLKNPDAKARAKTIRILHGKLKIRIESTRYPDLVPLVAELAQSHPDPAARCVCVMLLTNITPDGPVPEWLLTALRDPHTDVQSAGLHGTSYFMGPELFTPVADILASTAGVSLARDAARVLAELCDPRALPLLVRCLNEDRSLGYKATEDARRKMLQQYYSSIALDITKFKSMAIPHLSALLNHNDASRRYAAVIGLRVIGDPNTRDRVLKLKSDSDPEVRMQAEMSEKIWGI